MGFVLHAQFLGPRTKPNNRIGAKQCFNFVKLIHKLSGFYEGVQAGISLAMWLRLTLHRSRKIFFSVVFTNSCIYLFYVCLCVPECKDACRVHEGVDRWNCNCTQMSVTMWMLETDSRASARAAGLLTQPNHF